jgi:hypothetical protein
MEIAVVPEALSTVAAFGSSPPRGADRGRTADTVGGLGATMNAAAALPADHPTASRVAADAALRALAPDEVPADLLVPLREFCARHATIRAAYAAEVEGRAAIGLLLDEGASEAAVMTAAEAELSDGVPPFGMRVINDLSPGTLDAPMLAGRPVYER